MSASGWKWADLSDEQVAAVEAAEKSLGVDYLLAYQSSERDTSRNIQYFIEGLRAAAIEGPQVEMLKELEATSGVVLVAYQGSPVN